MSRHPNFPWPLRVLGSLVLAPILWAIPFALFFGTLYGAGWGGYRSAYFISLVFAFVIRSAIVLAESWIVPQLRRHGDGPRYPRAYDAAVYMATSILASYLAAFLV